MQEHSKTLEATSLWRTYENKNPSDERKVWIKRVYKVAIEELKLVVKTFPNYTLHDETHVLNVIDSMGGLLGNQINNLTIGEIELLILAACLHDIGMVYIVNKDAGIDEQTECLKSPKYKDPREKFLRKFAPDCLNIPVTAWPDTIKQDFLRHIHHLRVDDRLQKNKQLNDLFSTAKMPREIVSQNCIVAVCKSHGMEPQEIKAYNDLDYLNCDEVDPKFCVILLRLADLLDFDDTRAPDILLEYAAGNETSMKEFSKHAASSGFNYPDEPQAKMLPYKARCEESWVEHSIRKFLDWIDIELNNSLQLKQGCHKNWQREFPFPIYIDRSQIEAVGYERGDFEMTIDQDRIFDILKGDNLYEDPLVFIRELLQNSIDATLMLAKMGKVKSNEAGEPDFTNYGIYLWEWMDGCGNLWFRIDDQGTGMTLGMLQRYFLRLGKSYYESDERKWDEKYNIDSAEYTAISRFGIGFLSCFMCGEYAEISTLHFDDEKSKRDMKTPPDNENDGYALRLKIPGLRGGYYTVKNQARGHTPEDMPRPTCGAMTIDRWECNGYRTRPGTSIAIRLDTSKLGVENLRDKVDEYLYMPRMPVYYNGKRVGRTYREFMDDVHKLAEGEILYTLSDEKKREFEGKFPELSGQHPQLALTVIPLDSRDNNPLKDLSGAVFKYVLKHDGSWTWNEGDHSYKIECEIDSNRETIKLYKRIDYMTPKSARAKHIILTFDDFCNNNLPARACSKQFSGRVYTYNGISCTHYGHLTVEQNMEWNDSLIIMENTLRPEVNLSRTEMIDMPLAAVTVGSSLQLLHNLEPDTVTGIKGRRFVTVKEWRELRVIVDKWMQQSMDVYFSKLKSLLESGNKIVEEAGGICVEPCGLAGCLNTYPAERKMNEYYSSYLQDNYNMTVTYCSNEHRTTIEFIKMDSSEAVGTYDCFPPMMFCSTKDYYSQGFLCDYSSYSRRAINVDHPFAEWLVVHSITLKTHFAQLFAQIVESLHNDDADVIIKQWEAIRAKLLKYTVHKGINLGDIPTLSENDFWWV